MNKHWMSVFLIVFLSSCSTVPEKVPELIQISSNQIENQSAMASAEWEKSVAAANNALKLLELIEPLVAGLDRAKLSNGEGEIIDNFSRGLPVVKRQVENVLQHHDMPRQHLDTIKEITAAINFANEYVSKVVDENSRVEAVIKNIQSINQSN